MQLTVLPLLLFVFCGELYGQTFAGLVGSADLPAALRELKTLDQTKTASDAVSAFAEFVSLDESSAWEKYEKDGVGGGMSFMGFGASMSREQFKREFAEKKRKTTASSSKEDALRVSLEYTRSAFDNANARALIDAHYRLLQSVVDAEYNKVKADGNFFSLSVAPAQNLETEAIVTLTWPRGIGELNLEHVVITAVWVGGLPMSEGARLGLPRLVGPKFAIPIIKPNPAAACNVIVELQLSASKATLTADTTLQPAVKVDPPTPPTPPIPPLPPAWSSGAWVGILVRAIDNGGTEYWPMRVSGEGAWKKGAELKVTFDSAQMQQSARAKRVNQAFIVEALDETSALLLASAKAADGKPEYCVEMRRAGGATLLRMTDAAGNSFSRGDAWVDLQRP